MIGIDDFSPQNSKLMHVAIIPDGGRRWAKEHQVSYDEAYGATVEKLCDFLDFLYSNKVDVVTFYFSSVYNFKRSDYEVKAFSDAAILFMREKVLPVAKRYGVQVTPVGEISECPDSTRTAAEYIEHATSGFNQKKLFLCINYSSLHEISHAMTIGTGSSFVDNLWVPYPVNCVIRTGDAQVLSDFLLPQSAFARLFFFEKMFNDLLIQDVASSLTEYLGYELKYGE